MLGEAVVDARASLSAEDPGRVASRRREHDLCSRMTVGWLLAERESAEFASTSLRRRSRATASSPARSRSTPIVAPPCARRASPNSLGSLSVVRSTSCKNSSFHSTLSKSLAFSGARS